MNLHTVNKAYTLLKQDGYIQVHRQKGVVVHPDGMPQVNEEFMDKQRAELKPIVAESICRGMSKEQLLEIVETIHEKITSGR
ncbi:hypothetical protein D3C78_1130600 [compost metagenome]